MYLGELTDFLLLRTPYACSGSGWVEEGASINHLNDGLLNFWSKRENILKIRSMVVRKNVCEKWGVSHPRALILLQLVAAFVTIKSNRTKKQPSF